jgi:hypothetical protein
MDKDIGLYGWGLDSWQKQELLFLHIEYVPALKPAQPFF